MLDCDHKQHRPPIPEGDKRITRQACRFGCVMCGCPVYQYDHIIEYSDVRVHEAANLALLCGTHHDQKTRGQLPAAVVQAARENVKESGLRLLALRGADLFYGEDRLTFWLGSNSVYITNLAEGMRTPAIVIDDTIVLGIGVCNGRPVITARIFDADNHLLIRIDDNELHHTTRMWDITYIGTTLTFRDKSGSIYLVIRFDPPLAVHVERGSIYAHGIGLLVKDGTLTVLNSLTYFDDCIAYDRPFAFGGLTDPSIVAQEPIADHLRAVRYRYQLPPNALDGEL